MIRVILITQGLQDRELHHITAIGYLSGISTPPRGDGTVEGESKETGWAGISTDKLIFKEAVPSPTRLSIEDLAADQPGMMPEMG